MSLSQSQLACVQQNYKIISRWMHKTLIDWQIVLKTKGTDVLIYEEYIDSTNNLDHFGKFILLLGKYCPNLMHVRLLFSGEKSDALENGFLKSLLKLPSLKCLSLFDVPDAEIFQLKNDFNELTTLKLVGVDENVTTSDFANIFGSLKNLNSLIYQYKDSQDNRFVSALSDLSNIKALTLYYPPECELKQLKNCNQLNTLHLYNVDDKLSPDNFIDIFKAKRNLHTLSISFIDNNLATQLRKLDAYCPKLTYLTINQQVKHFGDFKNLKYLRIDMQGETSSTFGTEALLTALSTKYADRLQILDISTVPNHTHTIEITKLKSLKALICSSWPSNMFECLTQLAQLEVFSLRTFSENLKDNDALTKMIFNCKKLHYFCLPYNTEQIDELILALPDLLYRRNVQPETPFVLTLAGMDAVSDIDKLNVHPKGNLLQLDWNGKLFESKLNNLIVSLENSEAGDTARISIFKYPGKVAGDLLEPEDNWLSSMNYKLALKSCGNKFNLKYDQELINRCRNMSISNAEYEISNLKYAFNFKYDAIDEHNEYPKTLCD